MREFELEKHFSKWEFAARYHMTASDAQSMTVNELLEMAGEKTKDELLNCWSLSLLAIMYAS